MQKKIVTYFLLVVMALQMLPVRGLGRLLFNNLFTEEIAYIIDIEEDDYKKNEYKSLNFVTLKPILGSGEMKNSMGYISFTDMIPSNPHFKIIVPPPNC